MKYGLATLFIAIFLGTILVSSSFVQADNTDFTFCGGSSSRADSKIHLSLVSGSYAYTPLRLVFGSVYNCNYSIIVNGTVYREGFINTSVRGIYNMDIHFPQAGKQLFIVEIGDDRYIYDIRVLNRSYEAQVLDGYVHQDNITLGQYFHQDLIKVFSASLVGCAVGIGLAYWFKIEKIKQEPRRLL
jgi:hypothetical protein